MEVKHTLVLDSKDSLSKAMSELMETGTAVIITRNGRYYGVVDDRSLGYGFKRVDHTKCDSVIAKPPMLLPSASILERADAFLAGHFKALPVVDVNGRPLGITTRVELVDDMLKERFVPKTKVSDLMSAPVYTVEEDQTIASAKNLMKEYGCNRLVVLRNNKPVGVISTLDLAAERAFHRDIRQKRQKVVSEVKSLDQRKIKEFFRPDVTSVSEASTIEDAAKKMVQKQVSSVLVLADKKPVGVLSAVDLFKNLHNLAEGNIEISISGLPKEEMEMYPAIQHKIGSVLDKFSGSFELRNPRLHIKEEKSVYSIYLYLDTKQGHISLSSERSTLKQAVDELSDELDKVLSRKKDKRKAKKRKVHKTKPQRVRRRK